MLRKYPLILSLALTTLFAAASFAQNQPAGNPKPTSLAVVNLPDLIKDLDETVDADAAIANMRDGFTADSKKMEENIKALSKQLENPIFKAGSPELKKMQDDLMQKSMEYKVYVEVKQQQLFLENRRATVEIYRKVNDAIAEHAKANGIALVFMAEDINILTRATTPEQLTQLMSFRKVLYYHPDFDITRTIKEKMNTAYRLGKAK